MRYTTTVELGGKSATGLEVPAAVLEALGSGKRPAVTVTIGDYTYRTTVGSMGGRAMVPLSAEHRTAAGVAAGDEVEVELALDTAPRTVEVPTDLAAVLAAEGLRERFDALAFSHRKEHVRAVTDAKTETTRQRRIGKVVEMLQT
jgi:antitoxin component of MazEF toxin-antitoxin module